MALFIIVWFVIIVLWIAFCKQGAKPDNAWKLYLDHTNGEKQKPRILRTALPDKRLKRNDWHKHIHQLRNAKK